jgi:alpha-glucosidase (family GH31 glycosyl hydrolase)
MSDDDGLPTVVRMGLGLSIAGVSTYGSDLAGYQVALRKPSDKETFFRWTELGAWSPVMRTHHGTQPLKNWNLASDEETTQHFRKYAILHQQLTPYFELLAKEANETGISIWRHLAVEFPSDPKAWETHDEFMVGPSILVAPVLKKGATSRSVYLPSGEWHAWGDFAKSGDVAAPMDAIPVYVRAGSIVPMLPDTVRTVIAEAKGLVRDTDVGDDRELIVTAGPDTAVKETSGLEYRLYGLPVFINRLVQNMSWNGVPLEACTTAFDKSCRGDGYFLVIGPGKLSQGPDGYVEIVGGKADRRVKVRLIGIQVEK